MVVKINPSSFAGNLEAPPSKSHMQRVLAAALIKGGKTLITNAGKSEDDLYALAIIQQMGAKTIVINSEELLIESDGLHAETNLPDNIYFGESGLSLRMFTPLISISSREVLIHGKGSLLNRSHQVFDDIFPLVGVDFQSDHGFLPFKIKGPLQPANITIDGSKGSQFLTGMLMAYSATRPCEKVLEVINLKSKPYIDLTLSVLKKFNLPVPENSNYQRFIFSPTYIKNDHQVNSRIEGDWSSASFLLVAAAISGKVALSGLDPYSLQSDRTILTALKDAGCEGSVFTDQVEVETGSLKPFYFDATDCPDLFPPLVVLAAHCTGLSAIKGLNRLKDKESDRGMALQTEFAKMGLEIELDYDNNEMRIPGGKKLKGGIFDPHNDHRIAMACAVAALNADGESTIVNAECVNKSYPAFWEDLKKAGALIEVEGDKDDI